MAVVTGLPDAVESTLQLYPNPTSGQLTVTFNTGHLDLELSGVITGIDGKEWPLFREIRVNGIFSKTFDVSYLPSGIYLVNFTAGNTKIARKLLIFR
jgi:hypothetical protein